MYADYQNSIVNLSCSILKYYGAKREHSTLTYIDEFLKDEYKNVVIILLDGLGVDALQYHLNSFQIMLV